MKLLSRHRNDILEYDHLYVGAHKRQHYDDEDQTQDGSCLSLVREFILKRQLNLLSEKVNLTEVVCDAVW